MCQLFRCFTVSFSLGRYKKGKRASEALWRGGRCRKLIGQVRCLDYLGLLARIPLIKGQTTKKKAENLIDVKTKIGRN